MNVMMLLPIIAFPFARKNALKINSKNKSKTVDMTVSAASFIKGFNVPIFPETIKDITPKQTVHDQQNI